MSVTTIRMPSLSENKDGNQILIPPDEVLMRKGPISKGFVTVSDDQQQTRLKEGKTVASLGGAILFDTGASVSCFDIGIATKLDLPIVGRGSMTSASHENHSAPIYAGKIIIANLHLNVKKGSGANLEPLHLIALIGRDFMRLGTLFYNGVDGSISFAC